MAWTGNRKYHATFCNKKEQNVSLSIYEKDYAGTDSSVSLYAPGIVLEQPKVSTPFESIRGRGCNIFLKEPSIGQFEELFNNAQDKFKVSIGVDGVIEFEGFITPELYNGSLSPYNREINVPATDGLGILDRFTLDVSIGSSLSSIILDLLWETNLDYTKLYINSQLFEIEQQTGSIKSLFDQTFIGEEGWIKSNGDSMNGKEIITNVLKPFNAYIYQKNEAWYIERYEDFFDTSTANTSIDYVEFFQTSKGGTTIKSSETFERIVYNLPEDFSVLTDSQSLQKNSGYGKFELTRPFYGLTNLLKFSNFEDATSISAGTIPDPNYLQWTYSDHLSNVQYFESTNSSYFDVDFGSFELYDGISSKTRFTFQTPDDEETCNHLTFKFKTKGNYSTILNAGSSGTVGTSCLLHIENDTNDFWIYLRDGDVSTGQTNFTTTVNVQYTLNTESVPFIEDYDFKETIVDLNLWNAKDLLEKHNWITATIYPNSNNGVAHSYTWVKDPDINISTDGTERTNLIEGVLNTDYNAIFKDKIEFGDIDNFNYKNGFNLEIQGTEKTSSWYNLLQESSANSIPIEEKFIKDRMQPYNAPRYTMSVLCKDASTTTNFEIFRYSTLDPSLYFVNLGSKQNLQDNETEYYLEEYKNNDDVIVL